MALHCYLFLYKLNHFIEPKPPVYLHVRTFAVSAIQKQEDPVQAFRNDTEARVAQEKMQPMTESQLRVPMQP